MSGYAVDLDRCIRCASCAILAPQIFEVTRRVQMLRQPETEAELRAVEAAAIVCPMQAIGRVELDVVNGATHGAPGSDANGATTDTVNAAPASTATNIATTSTANIATTSSAANITTTSTVNTTGTNTATTNTNTVNIATATASIATTNAPKRTS